MAIPGLSPQALANGSTAKTQTASDNSTKLATTAYVDASAAATATSTYPVRVANVHVTNQGANIAQTVAYAVPSGVNGLYRVSFFIVETTKATTSSTLPTCTFVFTEAESGVVTTPVSASPGSGTGNFAGYMSYNAGSTNAFFFQAAGGSNITYGTSNYATSGATAMKFSLRCVVEYLGPA